METYIISGFLLGLAGGIHCVGMCGPLGMSLSLQGHRHRAWGLLMYLLGKTCTYGLLGFVFGLFGRQLALAGWQQALSVTIGVLLLLFALAVFFKSRLFHTSLFQQLISNKLLPLMSRVLKSSSAFTPLWAGMLNGLLPCGLVYMGLAVAVASGSALTSTVFMLFFGLGTLPLMLSFLLLAQQLGMHFRNSIKRITPYMLGLLAVVLILRGLNLGIPFLSPQIESLPAMERHAETIVCHP